MAVSQEGLDRTGSTLARVGLLAIAVLAVFALSATMASSAAAVEQVGFYVAGEESENEEEQPRFEAEAYPAYVKGDGELDWGFAFGHMPCPVEYSDELSSAGTNLTPNRFVAYFACETPEGVLLTINDGGCKDTIDLLNVGPPYVAEYGVTCPSESPYTFHLGESFFACTISIPAQSGLDKINVESFGKGSERKTDLSFEVTGLEYSISAKFPKLSVCGDNAGTHEDGTIGGVMTLEAEA